MACLQRKMANVKMELCQILRFVYGKMVVGGGWGPWGVQGPPPPVRVILLCIYCRKNMISSLIFNICSKSLLISLPEVLILAPVQVS